MDGTTATDFASMAMCPHCGREHLSSGSAMCGDCGGVFKGVAQLEQALRWHSIPPLQFTVAYCCFVFVSSLDLLLTNVVLSQGGSEVNWIAAAVLDHWGFQGLTAFKYLLVAFIIVMCEWTGRRSPEAGKKLSEWSVAITSIPIVLSVFQLLSPAA